MTNGIYTLANDVVYDQLVALLNSIEVNAGKEIPVCIIPYDNQLDKVRAEVAARENVTLFENTASITYWENFAIQAQAGKIHREAKKNRRKNGSSVVYALPMRRKLCSFDGGFEKFIYFDADTLVMGSLEKFYHQLDEYDWLAYDFQYKSDIKYIFDCSPSKLVEIFPIDNLQSKVFCAGWFASKKGVFEPKLLQNILEKLQAGESEVFCLSTADQPLLNYMVLRSGISYYNFAYHDLEQATGCHWSSQFDVVDGVLYDKGRRLTYLHHMCVPASHFTRLCAGEDIDIGYRDVFLHYRYLKSPEQRPKNFYKPNWFSSLVKEKINNLKDKLS